MFHKQTNHELNLYVRPTFWKIRTNKTFPDMLELTTQVLCKLHTLRRTQPTILSFVTKTVHLEVVMVLTSQGFIAAWSISISRREMPKEIHCDNATM